MGNTKYVTFDGTLIPREGFDATAPDAPALLIEQILRATHATDVILKLEETECSTRVFGALHSSSLCDCVGPLAALLSYATIVRADLDWTDCVVFDVEGGKVIGHQTYEPGNGPPRYKPQP